MVMPLVGDSSSGQLPDDSHESLRALDDGDENHRELLASDFVRASIEKVARTHGVPESDVEDIVQETLRRAMQANLPADEEEARKYTNGIAARVARHHLRELIAAATDPYVEEQEEGGPPLTPVFAQPARFEDREAVRKVVDAGLERFPRTFPWFLRSRVLEETAEEIARDHAVHAGHVRHEISVVQSFVQAFGQRMGVFMAFLVLLVMGITAWLLRPFDMRDLRTYEARRVTPPPLDAARLRDRAFEACKAQAWQACIDDIDEADRLDPASAYRTTGLRSSALERLVAHDWKDLMQQESKLPPKNP